MFDSVSQNESLPQSSEAERSFAIEPDDATRRMLVHWHAAHRDSYRVSTSDSEDQHWIVHDPDQVERVLVRNSRNYRKGMGLDRVRILLGNGIMVSEGDFWARQRRLL